MPHAPIDGTTLVALVRACRLPSPLSGLLARSLLETVQRAFGIPTSQEIRTELLAAHVAADELSGVRSLVRRDRPPLASAHTWRACVRMCVCVLAGAARVQGRRRAW